MHLQGYLLFVLAIPNIILSSFILIRNLRNKTNLFFGGFVLTAALWSLGLAGYIFSTDTTAALWWAREYYTAAALIPIFFLGFSLSFTGWWQKKTQKIFYFALLLLGIIIWLIYSSGSLIKEIAVRDWGKEVILNDVGYWFYGLYFASFVLVGFWFIFKTLKKATGLFKIYLKFLFFGLAVSFLLGMTFNLFYPAFGNYKYIWVGPWSTLIYVTSVSYAILRHKLFDIRILVARSVAYLLLLATLATIFAVGVFGATSIFFRGDELDFGVRVTFTAMAIVLAFAFQPLKRFFDKVTNRVFYRDTYDPQELLNRLNSTLVSTVLVEELLSGSTNLINKTLKSEFTSLWLNKTNESVERRIGTSRTAMNLTSDMLEELPNKATLVDELGNSRPMLVKSLRDEGVAVVIKLHHKDGARTKPLGYLLMGHKLSGGLYGREDIKVLEIISKELVIAVQNALRFEEIQRFNLTLQQKIDDATLQLRQANTRLKELDEAKDEFVSMASHQLRTPLTVIKGYLSMLLEGDMGKVTKQQKEIIQTAYDGAERMVFLIGDLLNVSRLQTGKFQIENQPTNLSEVIDHEVSHLQESAANHQLKLTFNKPKDFPKFMLDEAKIRQVIMNFIDNAIYYTPAGGSIDVRLEATDQAIVFTVNDTGLGVPKAEQHHLFSKFYRAGNARKMRPDGTGLGLYMAKKIIVAQGGAIIFKSEEGKGSTFGFSLPKKAVGQ